MGLCPMGVGWFPRGCQCRDRCRLVESSLELVELDEEEEEEGEEREG